LNQSDPAVASKLSAASMPAPAQLLLPVSSRTYRTVSYELPPREIVTTWLIVAV
jgi:hypothetical protein